jgi:hypothetical protein
VTPDLFATIVRPKLVDGVEVIPVAHNAATLESVIDGTDNEGVNGSMWHMNDAPADLDVALLNLQAIMDLMGWRIEDDWTEVEDANGIYVADFLRKPRPIVVADGEHR